MEFVINTDTIVTFAEVITSLSVIIGVIIFIVKQVNKWNACEKKIAKLQGEQYLQIKTMYAILDGLHQLGCNGKTTEASNELNDYLLKTANDIKTEI